MCVVLSLQANGFIQQMVLKSGEELRKVIRHRIASGDKREGQANGIRIPMSLNFDQSIHTCRGSLVKCSARLEVQANLDQNDSLTCCYGPKPKFSTVVIISNKSDGSEENRGMSMPVGVNFQALNPVIASIPLAQGYTNSSFLPEI